MNYSEIILAFISGHKCKIYKNNYRNVSVVEESMKCVEFYVKRDTIYVL